MFTLGWPEVAIIAIVILIILGPKKIPEIGKAFGKTLRGFRDEIKDPDNSKQADQGDS